MSVESQSNEKVDIAEYSPSLIRLLKNMDSTVVETFTSEQLRALEKATSDRGWRAHAIDFRPTLVIPFLPWSFYFVFLFGRNRRLLSSKEKTLAALMFLVIFLLFGIGVIGFIFVLLYLLKSALGIDLFPEQSLGLWKEFKDMFGD